MNNSELTQALQQQSYVAQLYQNYQGHDNRPVRIRLTELLQRNTDRIAELEASNRQIQSTLTVLDDHPYIEIVGDSIKKLLG